ncbi:sigma-70 family RNA polymerase sigma factor [Priestia aryabhattai]|uniref:sigma-70 family RNA polymerase sigma factor n=1 Tax=Priestia aryabhattai TaxID=412384 RepID=UPI002E20AB20|nr:sigma-70 family RNA polymerase sigma factor [Priestia aryabhattai]
MENAEDSCCKLHDFINKNKPFMKNPLIKQFLSNKENYDLFKNSVCHPTFQNKERLEKSFKSFYFCIRFISYVSSTLHFHAINLDKKIRKRKYQFPLLLDEPVNMDGELTYKDLSIYYENFDLKSKNILDYIIDPNLYKALEYLTPNQREILYLVYIRKLNDSEVGIVMEKSQQAVSKSRKKALEKIRKYMTEKSK